ncbi:hypothetical protein G1O98_06395 [Nostoc sp. UIC10630]|nr:hypothetical protein [Nostoc sp. LEGE 12447]NEU78710.1 hypothetical protein [Nostoc sp. UIC 10630]
MTQKSFTTQLQEQVNYTKPGASRKSLVKDEQVQFSLVCLTADTEIPEHVASRNISVDEGDFLIAYRLLIDICYFIFLSPSFTRLVSIFKVEVFQEF